MLVAHYVYQSDPSEAVSDYRKLENEGIYSPKIVGSKIKKHKIKTSPSICSNLISILPICSN